MLEFPEQSLDALLGLDDPPEDPNAYDNYGFAHAQRLSLCGGSGPTKQLGPCRVLAMHRSDDQSQAGPGHLDLEFETQKGPVWVDFASFVQALLVELAGAEPLVLALCNPDAIDLGSHLRPLCKQHPVYWAQGDVTAYLHAPSQTRELHAKAWLCSQPLDFATPKPS